MINYLIRNLILFLIWLRYGVSVRGLAGILERGNEGILFLPNHPSLIEPIITVAHVNQRLRTRVTAVCPAS